MGMDSAQARLAFDHDRASLLQARTQKGDAQRCRGIADAPLDPFGTGARLAGAAAAEHEPQAPVVALRLELRRPAPERKVMKKPQAILARRLLQELVQPLVREASQQVGAQIRL